MRALFNTGHFVRLHYKQLQASVLLQTQVAI